MLRLYNDHWYDPTSILSECATGVYMGFIPTSKGDFTLDAGLKQESSLWVQRETRNYLCGQMGIGHPLTQAFLDELRKRTARLFLVVYEGTHADATVHPTEPDLFISRHRSAMSLDELQTAEYSTTLTLEDIKNQLRRRKTSVYDPIVVDSWQFIIIDREVGLPFQLMEIVQDALMMLADDPTPRTMAKRVIRKVIPPSVQEIFLEEMRIESSTELRFPAPVEQQYEGNRYRCYDPDPSIITARQKRTKPDKIGRDAHRLIRRITEDMERCGIITLEPEYVEPQTRPLLIQSVDGGCDLYFPYDQEKPLAKGKGGSLLPLPAATCLLDYAQSYQTKHPGAIVAKGSIQTHYCAWPIPPIKSLGNTGSNFATWEGHVYRWNRLRKFPSPAFTCFVLFVFHSDFLAYNFAAFDCPFSANAWQYYVDNFLNSKLPFVKFYLTAFVICAIDNEDAERNVASLLEEMNDRGWRVTIPRTYEWTSDVEELKLESLYSGVRPA